MKWRKWRLQRNRGDPRGVERAKEELAISEHLLNRDEPVINSLREMRQRNNVTAIARKLRRE